MLLTRLLRRARSTEGERGSALLAVIAVMGVTAILLIVFGLVTVNNLGTTSAHRAGVQAQAAAEAGLADTLAKLQTSTPACSDGSFSGADPAYDAQIYTATATTAFSSTPACPTATTTSIKIVSTGTAEDRGVVRNTRGDKRAVEGVYVRAAYGAAAIYGNWVLGNDLSDFVTTGVGNNIFIKYSNTATGSAARTCNNSTDISGSVIIERGGLYVSGSCRIRGDVAVGGVLTVNGTSALIDGVATGQSIVLTGGATAAQIGTRTADRGASYHPSVPAWQNYSYSLADFTAQGFSHVTLAPWQCEEGNGFTQIKSFIEGTSNKLLINALACEKLIVKGNNAATPPLTIGLRNDVAIITQQMLMNERFSFISAPGSPAVKDLLIIVPAQGATGVLSATEPKPFYASDGLIEISDGSSVSTGTGVTGVIYTPGRVQISPTTWRGQIYAKNYDARKSGNFSYAPPKWFPVNIGEAASSGAGWTSSSIREVSPAG